MGIDGNSWYALSVRSRWEKAVSDGLRRRGFEELLPQCQEKHDWSDRIKDVSLPLFPGYVFCQFDISRRLPVLSTPGVKSIVGFGSRPYPLDPSEIDAIQTLMRSGVEREPCPYIVCGEPARIVAGPLRGVAGIVAEVRNQKRLILSVTLLQRSIAVEVEREWIEVQPAAPRSLAARAATF
jgi:transcription antitermination factor NusG